MKFRNLYRGLFANCELRTKHKLNIEYRLTTFDFAKRPAYAWVEVELPATYLNIPVREMRDMKM